MDTQVVFCDSCGREVRIVETPGPTHEGHAPLHDAETVCLDAGECPRGGSCSVTGASGRVMTLRLAHSGERRDTVPTARARCDGCGQVSRMDVVDRATLLCPLCGTTNDWILMEQMEHGWVAIGRPDAESF
jgi:hypothetical protein